MTIRENYVALKEFAEANGASAEMVEFIDSRIAQEDKAARLQRLSVLRRMAARRKMLLSLSSIPPFVLLSTLLSPLSSRPVLTSLTMLM